MKLCLLAVLLVLVSLPTQAQELSPREAECLSQIKAEADFIVSRINLVHREYEDQVKHSGLGKFKSGGYSTVRLLDHTIRKYHRRLVHKIENYPFRYERGLKSGHRYCLAQELSDESVGTIHEFELRWQKTLREARKNARYFKQLDEMN